ncbi:Xaa-Pro peptidase family protein [Sphingomonas sp. SUN039]|uniref:M24 family metallopeptidase n=1 Tax=Sphingomonas sp. SUN039 TaxID=2937787 RepID=UPI0021641D8E|nr:Xaa-Pro peptidase family protein [Sphingomonas sp. SUN039]UVO53265.1 Xaa-Pro peptidase family protein [Sphingomonas sp. SUN039]
MINRRQILATGGAGLALAAFPAWAAAPELASITGDVPRIGPADRAARIAKAQGLMRRAGIGAILIEAGSSLDYFTGVQWWRSERLTCVVIPVEGTPCIVTPFFEEPSIHETLGVSADVKVWQEDESPVALVAAFLKSRGLAKRPIGIEETVRYFASDGLAHALPAAKLVSANPVVRGCRMIKTSAEIALMQAASDVTVRAINHAIARTEVGMTPADITALIVAATKALGGEADGGLVLLGEASAYPHGSHKPQHVVKQEIILIDCGCSVGGYQSDISRTFVLGGANTEQRKVFGQVQEGQRIAFAAAKLGAAAGSVDDAVRGAYERMGYGPRYKLPGTPHRTGHGIGMDGHEPVNLVHGETTPLAPGMCFSNEPGIYAPGKFGVRIEDCFHMTEAGPKWFSEPQRSIE